MATVPAPPPAPAPAVDLAAVARAHLKIRDARAQLKQEFETKDDELKGQQAQLEGFMLAHLDQHGMESVRTDAGTFFRQVSIKPNIVDDAAFFGWIKTNDAFDALERRVKVGFIKEFSETHDGGLPPGIHVAREWVVRVRKPAS